MYEYCIMIPFPAAPKPLDQISLAPFRLLGAGALYKFAKKNLLNKKSIMLLVYLYTQIPHNLFKIYMYTELRNSLKRFGCKADESIPEKIIISCCSNNYKKKYLKKLYVEEFIFLTLDWRNKHFFQICGFGSC